MKNGREKELEKRKRKTKSKSRTYLLLQLSEFFKNVGRESGREKKESLGGEREKNSSPILCSISRPDSSSFSTSAYVPCWQWIWTLLKRSRCTVSFPLLLMKNDLLLGAIKFISPPPPLPPPSPPVVGRQYCPASSCSLSLSDLAADRHGGG